MRFSEIVKQASALLQEKGRVSYRMLQREFALDAETLEDLKVELIEVDELAVDKDGKMLVWTGGETVEEPVSQAVDAPTAEPSSSAPAPQSKEAIPAGERRQLTVMFCDLVGSTALSEQLDPEELQTVVRMYQEVSAQVIERYDGYIAQYLGDGLLVYFGYPIAHEDDAARSIRTGLEIVSALDQARSQFPQPVRVRIGIHTGPVVIGQMGGGSRHEQLALGETPNVAARVQGKAEPDQVIISAATQRLVAGLFKTEERGRHALKGISSPQALYQVMAESAVHNRFEVAVQAGLTPLVGREHELGIFNERWRQAQAGHGQAVLISGEPGMGKSRLVQELKEHLVSQETTQMTFQCSPYHQNSALYPVIEHWQRLLPFTSEDTPQTKLDKLQQTLEHYLFPQAETFSLFAALLSLPHPESSTHVTTSPQKQKELTQAALMAWLIEEAERAAVVCIWEDLHWVDPSSLELLTLCLDQIPTARMLVLLVFRPEFSSPWGTRSYLSQLPLSRLDRSHVEGMVERITGGRALPSEVVEQVATKTDGVPLFVEELTKSIVESDLVRAVNNHYELIAPLSTFTIPATLHDSLMSRLDRLTTAKEVVQLGATIGREFSYTLLQAVSPLDVQSLQHSLQQLVKAELVYQRGVLPQAHYLFKHALIQDTAYQSLLKSTRQRYHQQTAQVLERQFPETVETQPELVAHHYTEARSPTQAIPYWQQAGQRAVQRSANVEAVSHLTMGLELLKTLPDTSDRAQQELSLQLAIGPPLWILQGSGASAVRATYNRALELCRQLGETPQLLPTLLGLRATYVAQGDYRTARELSEQCLRLAQSVQDKNLLMQSHLGMGAILMYLGEFAPAREHLEQAYTLYDPQQHNPRVSRTSQDPGVVSLTNLAWTLWFLGYPEQAVKKGPEALALARDISHPFSLGWAFNLAAKVHLFRQEAPLVQEQAEAMLKLAADQDIPYWATEGTMMRGWALAEQKKETEGIAEMCQGLTAWRDMGMRLVASFFLAFPIEAYRRTGQIKKGQQALTEALTLVDNSGERIYEAELYRLKGTLTLVSKGQSPKAKVEEEAEECFRKAIAVARQQQAKSLELRAVMSLARLWQQQGKKEEARKMLSDIYSWFTEGFDTKDLQEAKALLVELENV